MAKRFTDTTKWSEDWYLDLPLKDKLFWIFVCDNCNHAGIFKPNKKLFEYVIGCDVDLKNFVSKVNQEKERIIILGNGRWYLKGFIEFQYGATLNPNSNVHKSVLKLLNENDINSGFKDLGGSKSKSRPGTISEVIKYFQEKGSTKKEGERFFYYYESQGWKVGRNKMKNWKMSASGWISRLKKDLPDSDYLNGQIKAIKG